MSDQMPSATPSMPSDGRAALHDISHNIVLAQIWTGDQTLEQFIENQQAFYAVTRCLEIISEAARKLPKVILDRHPTIVGHAVKASGNVYRHQYDDVLEKDVYHTVRNHLPALAMVVAAEQDRTT